MSEDFYFTEDDVSVSQLRSKKSGTGCVTSEPLMIVGKAPIIQ